MLEKLLLAAQEPVNLVFLAGLGLMCVFMAVWKVPASQWGGPLVSAGILGTFVGILLALLGFDTENIKDSVPSLLAGMKTAFLTSAVGMALALASRTVAIWQAGRAGASGPSSEDFYKVMCSQNDTLARHTELLSALVETVGMREEQSLAQRLGATHTELGLLRSDMATFMDSLTEQSSAAIIEGLEQVIQDFNSQLNTQFGENFAQLNQGVERLVAWMDTHQKLIESSHRQFEEAVKGLQQTQQTLKNTAASTATVAAAIEEISTQLKVAEATLEELRKTTKKLANDTLSLSSDRNELSTTIERFSKASDVLGKSLDAWADIAKGSKSATESILAMTNTVQTHTNTVTTLQRGLFDELRQQIDVSGRRNREAIEQQIKQLDAALEKELSAALNALGGKMASLSEKFVSDYLPLTERLAEVVQLAKAAGPTSTRGWRG